MSFFKRVTLSTLVLAMIATLLTGSFSPAHAQSGSSCPPAPAGMNVINSNRLVITGTPGDDFICAGDRPNRIDSGGGDDIVYGNGGADIIRTRGGDDIVYAGRGDDKVHGGAGNDIINGGWGRDLLQGAGGRDTIDGEGSNDILRGGAGRDLLVGGAGSDKLNGKAGQDTLVGGTGDDELIGGRGNDRLKGGIGTDSADGGSGIDRCVSTEDMNSCERPTTQEPAPDTDSDGIGDGIDNCVDATNPSQDDTDRDGVGDACDTSDDRDDDGDEVTIAQGDCDDNDDDINPDSYDHPYDGIDQDCSGADWTDIDNDGHQSGTYLGGSPDCNDIDPDIHPDATDIANDGIDQNCDGADARTWYNDADNDTFGDDATKVEANTAPDGHVARGGDCDDTDPVTHPGASDIPYDGVDQDCTGADHADLDGDSHDATEAGGTDCDDDNNGINPDEYDDPYDGIDQDCTGSDANDFDGDGHISTASLGGAPDCNDLDANINPDATDIVADGIDQDCDGADQSSYFIESNYVLEAASYAWYPYYLHLAAGDVDGDGDIDVIAAEHGGSAVFFNDGGGNMTKSAETIDTQQAIAVALGDLDGDGDLDLVIGDMLGNDSTTLHFNDGSGTFTDSGQALGGGHTVQVVLADIDGDNDLDVHIGKRHCCDQTGTFLTTGNGVSETWVNDGVGNFSLGQNLGPDSGSALFGDIDGDGDIDMIGGGTAATGSRIWTGDGSGNFTDTGNTVPHLTYPRANSLRDIDLDGDLDLVGTVSTDAHILLNDGTGQFTDSGRSFANDPANLGYVGDVFDVDLDGHLDLVHMLDTGFGVFINDGTGQMNDVQDYLAAPDNKHTMLVLDIDGDGDQDLIDGTYAGAQKIWINTTNQATWYVDADDDGFGDPDSATVSADLEPAGYVGNATDCDDTDNTTYPGAPDAPLDGIDQNCDGRDATEDPEEIIGSPIEIDSTFANENGAIQPLNGLPLGDPSLLSVRPVAVKIDNAEQARPQYGIEEADLIYEVLIENQTTRFLAVFHSSLPQTVGPVRSSRSSDIDLMAPLSNPLFASSGSNDIVGEEVRTAQGDGLLVSTSFARANAAYLARQDRPAPHNLSFFPSILNAASFTTDPVTVNPVFRYLGDGDTTGPGAIDTTEFEVSTNHNAPASYVWNDIEQGWLRSQAGTAHVAESGAQLSPANVVVLEVQYGISLADAASPQAFSTGTGVATVFTNGQRIEGTWQRTDSTQGFDIVDSLGNKVRLAPGQTIVHLIEEGDLNIIEIN